MKKLILMIFAVVAASLCGFAMTYLPGEMPNVQLSDRRDYISDPGNLLSAGVKEEVNQRLYELRQQTSVEAVVAIPPSIGDESIEAWSTELFSLWGIGKKDKDNGVLLVIVPDDRLVRIETGYGVEGVLTDIACGKIIRQAIIPAMKEGNLDAAVNNATALMASALEDPAVADELRSSEADNFGGGVNALSADVLWEFVRIIMAIAFVFGLGLFVYDAVTLRGHTKYDKARTWRSHLSTYLVAGILSCGTGLIFWLLALWCYRSTRNSRIKCPTCGTRMNKLSEEEDNEFLNDSQDFEEQIGSVDYDVWLCPKCHTVERFPYPSKNTKYTECPACHTVAMCLVSDTVTRQPTVRAEGVGTREYECQFCHHRKRDNYRIEKKPDPAVMAAALGAAAAASRGSGSGGGGSFGGGFGGGSSGGGGASGSW